MHGVSANAPSDPCNGCRIGRYCGYMDLLTRHSWLCVRGEESIRIVHDGQELLVCGPQSAEETRIFASTELLKTFVQQFVEHLTTQDGWTLEAYDERRSTLANAEIVPGDRRRPSRLMFLP
jgi:hypothetical protein